MYQPRKLIGLGQCDARRPFCSSCLKRQISCDFLEHLHSPHPTACTLQRHSSQFLYTAARPRSLDPTTQDLELMYHWTNVVCVTLSDRPFLQQLWKVTIPGEAVSHSYLMHGVLALSALHLSYVHPTVRVDYRTAAMVHHNFALACLTPLLDEIVPQNCNAIFALSIFVTIFAIASQQPSSLNGINGSVEEILQIAVLVRGIAAVKDNTSDWIAEGDLGPLLMAESWRQPVIQSIPVREALRRLQLRTGDWSGEMYRKALYQSAILSLLRTPDTPGVALVFLVLIESDFIDLLKMKDPIALVILAHYGVLLHTLRQSWWLRDAGYRLVEDVYHILDASWHPWIFCAMESVGMRDSGNVQCSYGREPWVDSTISHQKQTKTGSPGQST